MLFMEALAEVLIPKKDKKTSKNGQFLVGNRLMRSIFTFICLFI
jgi:hypothetical protein